MGGIHGKAGRENPELAESTGRQVKEVDLDEVKTDKKGKSGNTSEEVWHTMNKKGQTSYRQ